MPLGMAASPMGAVEALSHTGITDLSTSVSSDCSFVKVPHHFNYFTACQKCCAVVLKTTEHIPTYYVCSLCLLLIAPLILLSALPSQVPFGLPCTHRIALSSTHAAQPRGIAHTQIELIHTHTNSFNLSG